MATVAQCIIENYAGEKFRKNIEAFQEIHTSFSGNTNKLFKKYTSFSGNTHKLFREYMEAFQEIHKSFSGLHYGRLQRHFCFWQRHVRCEGENNSKFCQNLLHFHIHHSYFVPHPHIDENIYDYDDCSFEMKHTNTIWNYFELYFANKLSKRYMGSEMAPLLSNLHQSYHYIFLWLCIVLKNSLNLMSDFPRYIKVPQFRKLSRILVCGKVKMCREVFKVKPFLEDFVLNCVKIHPNLGT